MTKYLIDARHHAERIEYFYVHAGTAGYAQALRHEVKLRELLGRAQGSKKGRDDIPLIQAIIEDVGPRMHKMKELASEADDRE